MTEPTTRTRPFVDADRDPVHLAAADWFTRLQDPDVSLEDTLAWQEWMKADARHSDAFARIEEVSLMVRELRSPPPAGSRELARDRYDASTPLSTWRAPRRSRAPLAIAAAIVLSCGVVAAIALKPIRAPWDAPANVFATSIGENRTVTLQDGSRITLGGNTRIEVALSETARSIELARGEAFFAVAKDPDRPFRVRAGDTAVTAIGTQFNVRRDSDRAVVTVTEGRVVVEPVSHIMPIAVLREFKPKLRPVRVEAGEQAIAGDAGIEDAIRMEDAAATTSWQTGRLAFRLQPLRYVLEDVNRYTRKPIVLEDESIGALLITGTVTNGSVGGWIASLEQGFGLEAVEEPERILVRRRR